MAKEGETALSPFWRDLFSLGFYKRSQGRIARQVTFGALALAFGFGAWSLYGFLLNQFGLAVAFASAVAFLVVGVWLGFRLVNMPRFADFLISVEAEMNKVSWPTRTELVRSAVVVMVTIFGLAILLYVYDLVWQLVLGPNFLQVIGG